MGGLVVGPPFFVVTTVEKKLTLLAPLFTS